MRFENLDIKNFKAITHARFDDLKDVVTIAGPNGTGKSTVFDAVRFWKYNVGSYQKNELNMWLSEFGFNENSDLISYHQDRSLPFSIEATVSISAKEAEFIKSNARGILKFYYYRQHKSAQNNEPPLFSVVNLELMEDYKRLISVIEPQVAEKTPLLEVVFAGQRLSGSVTSFTDGRLHIVSSDLTRILLSAFFPQHIGIIDFYSSDRHFSRDNATQINVAVESNANADIQQQMSSLYNVNSKYGGTKTELAKAYVKSLIAQAAGAPASESNPVQESVERLFSQFLNNKSFEGVKPTIEGALTYNVITPAGNHDISDLSSGEKELIYGYLRLIGRNLRDSVILIDEPELHLNPRLTNGLPDFYYRTIGRPQSNQIWLVTHSDNILRQSVGLEGFDVFHMEQTLNSLGNQVTLITAERDINRAVVDLIGDLAAYKPGGKLVLVEGGGDSEFDKAMIERLFPDFGLKVNLVSAQSKSKVKQLHSVLTQVGVQRDVFSAVYSIADQDSDSELSSSIVNHFTWDRYHIENYLLEPTVISEVLSEQMIDTSGVTDDDIAEMLRLSAHDTKDILIRHGVEQFAFKKLNGRIKIRTDQTQHFTADALFMRIEESVTALRAAPLDTVSKEAIEIKMEEINAGLERDLLDGEWVKSFRGRDILKRFLTNNYNNKITYDVLKRQIIARMASAKIFPSGMKHVLVQIEPGLKTI